MNLSDKPQAGVLMIEAIFALSFITLSTSWAITEANNYAKLQVSLSNISLLENSLATAGADVSRRLREQLNNSSGRHKQINFSEFQPALEVSATCDYQESTPALDFYWCLLVAKTNSNSSQRKQLVWLTKR